MNWKEIKKKYPKGLDTLFAWLNIEEYDSTISKEVGTKWYQFEHGYLLSHEGFCWNKRNLYDFFDELKIYVTTSSGITGDNTLKWMWEIHKGQRVERVTFDPCIFNTRKEAEKIAFEKAFEILEIML